MSYQRLILVTTSLPPTTDSQTIRLRHLLSAFLPEDWELIVISPGGLATAPEAIAALNWRGKWKWLAPPLGKLAIYVQSLQSRPGKWGWLGKNILYRLMYPDAFGYWTRPAIRALKEAIGCEPAFILTSSGSPVSHLAALSACEASAKARWIADFGDPWADVDRRIRPHWYPRSLRDERRCLAKANLVLCTSDSTAKKFAQRSRLGAPIEVLEYGFERSSCGLLDGAPRRSLSFSYIGAAHVKNRNLIPLISTIGRMQKEGTLDRSVGLVLAGNYSDAFTLKATELNVPFLPLGRISYERSHEVALQYGCQVIVGNKESLQIPGKIFICLSLPRPILYIRQSDPARDPALQLLRMTPGLVEADNTTDRIEMALANIRDNYEALMGESEARVASDALNKYEARAISKRFQKLIATL